jgi:hypothetical protein
MTDTAAYEQYPQRTALLRSFGWQCDLTWAKIISSVDALPVFAGLECVVGLGFAH